MTQDEERLTESNSNINTVSEVPAKPFRITMEFPLFLVMMQLSLCGAAISNIILYRTCVHSLNYPEDTCKVFLSLDKTNQTRDLEAEVQKYVATVSMVKSILESIVPAILSLFLGVWSDTHGRKPLIVWPLLGFTMTSGLTVVYSMMDNLGPWWYILTVIPFSLSGGFTILFTGAFCYLSDVTTTESRSLRMTVMEAGVSLGSVVGSVLSPYVLRQIGNVYLILLGTALNVVAYVFTNVCLRESLTGAIKGGITSVLDFLLVKEMIRECFKRRPNRGRSQILLLTVANSMSIFILYGLMPLDYLYTREKLHWSIKEYTQFSAVSTTISFVGSFVGIALFQKLMRASDLTISNVAYVSTIADYMIRTFSTTSWHMYLATSVSAFRGLSSPLIRSFLTKILPVTDIAKVFALMSAIEGISPLLSPLVYNSLYEFTVLTFPGAVYILSSGIVAICITCLVFVQVFRWSMSPYQQLTSD